MNGVKVYNLFKELGQSGNSESYSNLEYIATAFRNSMGYTRAVEKTAVPLFEKFCKAAVLYSDFYHSALGDNFVCNMLRNDIIANSYHAIEVWKRESPDAESVEEFLKSQIKIHTLEEVKLNSNSAINKFLWTVRAANFIQYFIENLISASTEDLHFSARDAYNKSLRPYHGFIKAGIAMMAFKLIPSKTDLILSLGYPDTASGLEALKGLLLASKPCIDQINVLLEKYGCNFQDKV